MITGERQPLRLRLRWAGSRTFCSGDGERIPPGMHIGWPECAFSFEHDAMLDALATQHLEITLESGRTTVARLSLPVEALACGPAPNDHALLTPSGVTSCARIVFRCRISELREWRLQLRQLKLCLDEEAAASLGFDGEACE